MIVGLVQNLNQVGQLCQPADKIRGSVLFHAIHGMMFSCIVYDTDSLGFKLTKKKTFRQTIVHPCLHLSVGAE